MAGLAGAGERAAPQASAERGRALYETGLLPDGSALSAQRDGMGSLPARAAACISCHRHSLRGGTEGGVRVPPVSGDRLFAVGELPTAAKRLRRQWLRHQTRSAYTSATLARALAEGLDPDGKPLSSAMPRYHLDAQAGADLEAYLRQRGADPTPGLGGGVMHLASVVTPQASPERRRTVVQALQAWSRSMGFKAFQVKWQLWELQGPSSTWVAQLNARWQVQPVYALLSGAGGHEWEPVEAFCETQQLPCLFPVLDRIPQPTGRHWSMYLGGGVDAEARLLAQALPGRPVARLFQVHNSPAGQRGAQRLAQAIAAAGSGIPVLEADAVPDPPPGAADAVVLWLPSGDAQAWLQAHVPLQPSHAPRVVLSAQLAPPQSVDVPEAWRSRVLWVSQRSDPVRHAGGAALSLQPWMAQLGLAMPAHPNDLADVHAATFFFGDAFAQTLGQFQPDHLLERLEVALDRRPAGAGFYRLSLGPGQRIASQGGHLLAFQPPDLRHLAPVTAYRRADD
jgi:Cytochrome c